ncbi:MAG: CvpA family protein [Phycisphaerae bacterium]|nr:CvpA family protein [Phycisphaerae bacterium]
MAVWLILLAAAGFGFYGIKHRFYTMWLTLFNIMLSTFLSVMLTPFFLAMISEQQKEPYHKLISVAVVFCLCYAFLYIFKSVLFDKDFEVNMPRFVDGAGSGLLGAICGYLFTGFAFFVICAAPFGSGEFVEQNFKTPAVKIVTQSCDFVNCLSLHCSNAKVEKVITDLLAADKVDDQFADGSGQN